MDQRVAEIISLIAAWRGLDVKVTPLLGGITNQNYRVDAGDDVFVLRIGGSRTQLLGIDRGRERICTELVARVGVAAEVVYFLPAEDVLITHFIPGKVLTSEVTAQDALLERIVHSLRLYHAGSPFPGVFSPFKTVRSYHTLALQHRVAFPRTLPRVFSFMERIEKALQAVQQLSPCHNDLLASNFIDDGQMIRIIDWEYAGMGDFFFDLGNFAANQSFTEEQCALLLRLYFGEVRATDWAHFNLMRLSSDLREAFWGFLQSGISELDFDYLGYAVEHLERFLQNVENPHFEQWLRDVAGAS